ncbi:MAG: RNA-binding domain-containing protein [Kiritimatiellia bacterium]|jgi:hypothetical protein
MQAREVTVEQLFSGDVTLVAPSFQRPYAWVRGACASVLAGCRGDDKKLFLRAVVTMDIAENENAQKGLLVDGNHRVTTVLVALLAVRDTLAQFDPSATAAINDTCFLSVDPSRRWRFKLIVHKKDRATFESLVLGSPPPSPACPLLRAYKFNLEAFADDNQASLERHRDRLLREFTFIHISLARDEDPYPVFKLLNAPDEDFTRQGLNEYIRFSRDPELMGIIAGGESQEVEFKESVVNRDRQDLSGSAAIARSVAGFMNSLSGGALLIGVRDDGSIRGVDPDYPIVDRGKSSWDGFFLFLNNMLRTRLSAENPFLLYTIERRRAMDRDVCLVRVKPAPRPVYLDKRLFVRSGAQTIEMLGPDLVHYVATRWPQPLPLR